MDNKLATIGIDIGGTNIKYGLIGPAHEIFWSSERPTMADTTREVVMGNILDAARECLDRADNLDLKIQSIGIGTPGLVGDSNAIVGGANNISGWSNFPLGDLIGNEVGIPVSIINDANAMAIGEYYHSCEGSESVVFITLGTGIGGAIIINGKLFQGHHGMGTELGVFPMWVDGGIKNWEDVASTAALVRLYQSRMGEGNIKESDIDGKYIIGKYRLGDPIAVEVVERFIELVAMGIGGYINVFNPNKVIVGGGISESGDIFMDKLRNHIKRFALRESLFNVEISAAGLGNTAGYIGAAIFAMGSAQNKGQIMAVKTN